MSKGMKNIVLISIVIIAIFAVLFIIYNQSQNNKPIEPKIAEVGSIVPDANSGFNHLLQEALNESTENNSNTENSKTQNTVSTNSTTKETEDDSNSTPREKKAVELVKKEWQKQSRSLSGVTFNNVGIQTDGKYRVSVNDATTTQVIEFYLVDVDTGVVTEK